MKVIILFGTVLLIASRLFYLLAPGWTWLYVAIVLYYLGARITCTSCTVTCADGGFDFTGSIGRSTRS